MKAPLLEQHEIKLVKDFVLLPVLLDVLQRDLQAIQTVRIRLAPLFARMLRETQPLVFRELAAVKQELRVRGIRVYEQRRTPQRLEVKYKCRGYDHRLHLLWGIVRAELLEKMEYYLSRNDKDGKGS